MEQNNNSNSRIESFLENPNKALWTLAIPIMFGMGIHTLYNLIDMIFIGRLGGSAIAGVAFNMPIFFLMLGLTMGLGSGITSAIARYIGEKNKEKADNSADHALFIAAIISFFFTIAGVLYGRDILIILGAKGEYVFFSFVKHKNLEINCEN